MCTSHVYVTLLGYLLLYTLQVFQHCNGTEITEGSSPEPAIVHIKHPIVSIKTSERLLYIHLKDDVHNTLVDFPGAPPGCNFRGDVLDHTSSGGGGGTAAVTACHETVAGPQVHAMIITKDSVYILEPASSSVQGNMDHVLVKGNLAAAEKFCGFNTSLSRRRKRETKKNIEVGVFVDKAMAKSLETRAALTNKVLAMMNQVQLIYNYKTLNPNFDIVIVKYQVLDKDAPSTARGDIDTYLDNFCHWQCAKNADKRWDHAILLTGLDLYKETGASRNTKVLGLAWVNGMCRCMYSCTINEGKSFEAAFVIAHEMGHSLGMQHDGTGNECDREKYIMSDRTGAGKTNWSPCSNKYLQRFLQRPSSVCLSNVGQPESPEVDLKRQALLPGEAFPAEDQCRMALGDSHRPYRGSKSPFNDVCTELWCLDGSWATPAHPALDGTTCASGKYCREGACVTKPRSGSATQNEPQTATRAATTTHRTTTTTTTTTTTRRPTGRTPYGIRFTGFFDDLLDRVGDFFNFRG